MDIKIKFSFLKLFNSIKGVGKTAPQGQCDRNWLNKKASKATQERFKKFFEWCKTEGIQHPKVEYPVMFGEGDSAYAGMLALEDIGPNEPIVKVPSRLIISTAKAFECPELRPIFYENPDIFGKHVALGEDNVLDAYILYHLNLGAKSQHYQMMQCWPTPSETDILMNWDDDSLEWLQDPTLAEDAAKGYDEFTLQWNNLYKCLRKYPELFPESAIGLNKFKWVYILTTNRCFGSNWPGVCQMVPFADYVNHENVDTGFDCCDSEGVSLEIRRERDEETARDKWRAQQTETRNSIFNMKTDLLDIEMQLRKKILEKGLQTQSQDQIDDQAMNLKLMQQVQSAFQNVEPEKAKQPEEAQPDEKGYLSSGLSSDDDVDLMLEQEVMRDKRKYGVAVNLPPAEAGSTAGIQGSQEIVLGKDESMRIWELTLQNVPKEYEFQIRTYNDVYPKGSQVYICYGRMSNREMLKRYGFCLANNKYNNMFIKLRLDVTDPDFKYRYYILQKFFNMEIDDGLQKGSLNVQSRHFKIYYQKFNRKILKFVKILSFNVKEDDIATVIESRSLSLEYISLQKLKGIYEDFLNSFPTPLKDDLAMMRDPNQSKHFTVRHYMGMVYRTEQKRILINQIKLVKVAMHILERIMRGQTLEFAVLRVHELESKQDHPVNRIMLANYLTGLQHGMQANAELYYVQRGLKKDEGEELLREVQREMRFDISRQAYKQFEVRGYEKMMERIIEAPMASAMLENHSQLQDTLLSIQEALAKQKEQNEALSQQVEAKIRARQALKAIEDNQVSQESMLSILPHAPIENSGASGQDQQEQGSDVSYYDSEYESETDEQSREESKENTSGNISKMESMKQEWVRIQSMAKKEQTQTKSAEVVISASTSSSKDVYFD